MPEEFDKTSIWSGVYRNFTEAKGNCDAFSGDIWLEKIAGRANAMVSAAAGESLISSNSIARDYILPAVAVAMLRPKLRILDFGGGLAASFYPTMAALPDCANVDFCIIENEAVCAKARKLLPRDDRLSFMPAFPPANRHFDIVHIGSALHYVENWAELLEKFASYCPDRFTMHSQYGFTGRTRRRA